MRLFLRYFPLLCFAFLTGCQDSGFHKYDVQVRKALASAPEAIQLEQVFGPGRHFIANYNSGSETLDSLYFIHGRYKITLSVPLILSPEVRKRDGAALYIHEILRVDWNQGIAGATIGRQWIIKDGDLVKLLKSGGDLNALGIKLDAGKPVHDFERYVNAICKDIRTVRPL